MKEALEKLRNDFSVLVESQAAQALLLKARHDALIQAGFTKEEALEIIKARGIMP